MTMKQLKVFALMLFAGATLFTSCKKDETSPAPTVTVTNDKVAYTITGAADTTITFNVTVAAEGEIETFQIKKTVGTTTTTYGSPTGFAGQTSFVYNFQETFTTTATYPQTFKFMVTDKEGQTAEISVTISKQAAVVNTPFATEVLTGTFYHIAGLLHGAYDLDGDATVGASGTASAKSMKNTDAAGITFTGSWTSDPANGTQYVKVTTAYASIYQENAPTLYAAGSASATVTNPAANDVYIAKKGSTYYVVQILTVEPTYSTGTGGNTGRITFKYKK
jgi:hypothetical protein